MKQEVTKKMMGHIVAFRGKDFAEKHFTVKPNPTSKQPNCSEDCLMDMVEKDHKHNYQPKDQSTSWEKDFDKRFGLVVKARPPENKAEEILLAWSITNPKIKDFIRALLASSQRELLEKIEVKFVNPYRVIRGDASIMSHEIGSFISNLKSQLSGEEK